MTIKLMLERHLAVGRAGGGGVGIELAGRKRNHVWRREFFFLIRLGHLHCGGGKGLFFWALSTLAVWWDKKLCII